MTEHKCPVCGNEVEANATKCNACGHELTACPDCGYIGEKGMTMCPECGCVIAEKRKPAGARELSAYEKLRSASPSTAALTKKTTKFRSITSAIGIILLAISIIIFVYWQNKGAAEQLTGFNSTLLWVRITIIACVVVLMTSVADIAELIFTFKLVDFIRDKHIDIAQELNSTDRVISNDKSDYAAFRYSFFNAAYIGKSSVGKMFFIIYNLISYAAMIAVVVALSMFLYTNAEIYMLSTLLNVSFVGEYDALIAAGVILGVFFVYAVAMYYIFRHMRNTWKDEYLADLNRQSNK